MDYSYFIGIDISKKTLDLAVRDRKQHLFHVKADNSPAGLNQFKQECLAKDIDLSKSLICWGSPAVSIQACIAKIF